MGEEIKTHSIALRLRKTIFEDAYVSVPVTQEILKENEDGSFGIDFEKFVAEAIRISEDPSTDWRLETTQVDPHPVQSPRPDNR
jgi:hypothetical protein